MPKITPCINFVSSLTACVLTAAATADYYDAVSVGYRTTVSDFGGALVTSYVVDVYLRSDDVWEGNPGSGDTLLNIYNWNTVGGAPSYFQSFTGTGWIPTNLGGPFNTEALQQADSFVTIGGFDCSTATPPQSPGSGAGTGLDPNFGPNNYPAPGVDAGWYNGNPPNYIGGATNTMAGIGVLIARFSSIDGPFSLHGTTFDATWNAGLGTPGNQAEFTVASFEDCNADGLWDAWAIANGESPDYNADEIPDDCEGYVVGSDYPTISAAVDAAPAGSVVLIPSDGVYSERIVIDKAVIIAAPNGATIAGTAEVGAGTVIIADKAPPGAALVGLTITGGENSSSHPRGAGIVGEDSWILLADCILEGNSGPDGGGARFRDGGPRFVGCEFIDNVSDGVGGGLRLHGGAPVVEECVFRANDALSGRGLAMASTDAALTMIGGRMSNHDGSPMLAEHSATTDAEPMLITGVTIQDNFWMSEDGAAIEIDAPAIGDCELMGNKICGNSGAAVSGPFTSRGGNILLEDRCPNWIVPDNASSIYAAVIYSSSGDRIVVRPGDHSVSNTEIRGMSLELMGTNDPADARPVIHGTLTLDSTLESTLIRGLQFEGGLGRANIGGHGADRVGGGLILLDAQATIEDCLVRENAADLGGGVFIRNGEITIRNTAIVENEAGSSGGGIHVEGDGNTLVALEECLISANRIPSTPGVRAGGLDARSLVYAPQLSLLDTTIAGNVLENLAQGSVGGGFTDLGGNTILLANDCDLNGVEDLADISDGDAIDCNGNLIPDRCEIADGSDTDCDRNGLLDSCDLADGAIDLDLDDVLDVCQDQLVFQVPSRFSTIAEAIEAAPDGSRIQLASDVTYETAVDLGDKNLEIIGDENDPSRVTIETPGQNRSVFTIADGQDHRTRVAGITIKNGVGDSIDPVYPGITLGGGFFIRDASPIIEDCIVRDNRAGMGGGLYLRNSNATLRRIRIVGNSATTDGAGISWTNGRLDLEDCDVIDNLSGGAGGGLFATSLGGEIAGGSFSGNLASDDGGGIWLMGSAEPTVIRDLDISANTTGRSGGGVHAEAGDVLLNMCAIEDNIAVLHGAGVNWSGTTFPLLIQDCQIVNNSVVEAPGGSPDPRSGGGVYASESNPGVQFDFAIAGNICGNLPNDIYGPYQVIGGVIDCRRPCGDFNRDGQVNGADVGDFLAYQGPCPDELDCPWDINLDGIVDNADFGLLLALWGPCP